MNRLTGLALTMVLATILLLVPACGGGGDGGGSHSIVGAWQMTTINGAAPSANEATTLLCNADGTGLTTVGNRTRAMTWSLVGSTFTILEAGHDPQATTISWLSSTRFQSADAAGNVMVFDKF